MNNRQVKEWSFNNHSGTFDIDNEPTPVNDSVPYTKLFNTLSVLKVGQSFFVENVSIKGASYLESSVNQYANRHNPSFVATILPTVMFEVDENDEEIAVMGMRVCRVEDREL